MISISSARDWPDGLAVGLSGLCITHCLALPVLVSVMPALGLLAEEWVHRSLVVAAIPLSLVALALSGSPRGDRPLAGMIAIGLTLLVAGAFVEPLHDQEALLTALGATILAAAHALRWRRHRALRRAVDGPFR